MLVGPITANVRLTSNLAGAPQPQLEIVVATVVPGFFPQRGCLKDTSSAGRPRYVNRVCAEALQ
jgi:hypothetical protein